MKERDWNGNDLAEKLGTSRTVAYSYLHGTTPSLDTATRIAHIFGLTLSGFIKEDQTSREHTIEECLQHVNEAVKKASAVSDQKRPQSADPLLRPEDLDFVQALDVVRREMRFLSPKERDKFVETLRSYAPPRKE